MGKSNYELVIASIDCSDSTFWSLVKQSWSNPNIQQPTPCTTCPLSNVPSVQPTPCAAYSLCKGLIKFWNSDQSFNRNILPPLYLTYLFPMYPFSTLENIRKRKVFWCFQGGQKRCIGNKWVKGAILCILRAWLLFYSTRIYTSLHFLPFM